MRARARKIKLHTRVSTIDHADTYVEGMYHLAESGEVFIVKKTFGEWYVGAGFTWHKSWLIFVNVNENFKSIKKGNGLMINDDDVNLFLYKEFSKEVKTNKDFWFGDIYVNKKNDIVVNTNSPKREYWEMEVENILEMKKVTS